MEIEKIKRPYYQKEDLKTFIWPADMLKILSIASPSQRFNIVTSINTGGRINELRNVKKEDIDFERKNLTFRVTKVRSKLGEKRPSPRIIPISTKFAKYLKKNINNFQILSTDGYNKMLKTLAKRAELIYYNDLSSHNIRKTFGTWLLALGINGFKVAQILGHSPEMLRTTYASPDILSHRDKEIVREILDDLPHRLRGEY